MLYRCATRVFPVQGPTAARGFWSTDSDRVMRRFVAIAPRGVTIEYTVDRILTELQTSIRRLMETPEDVCRSAGIYRSFEKYVDHGDRFIEPTPVTRRSRRVLERTIAGLALARILAIHEPANGAPLTTVARLRSFVEASGLDPAAEAEAIAEALQLAGPMDQPLRRDLDDWYERFFRNLRDPGRTFRFPSDLSPTGGPMLSLRDVEEQAPVYGDRLR